MYKIPFLILLALLLGCSTTVMPTPTLIFEPTTRPGTDAPVSTEIPPRTRRPRSTRTPVPTQLYTATETPVPTSPSQADKQATIQARATASPFPTASTVLVQRGSPAIVTAQRDGLTMRVELAQDNFLAGEGGRAIVTLENNGPETLMFTGGADSVSQLVLLDERGHEPAPFPWQHPSMPGMPRLAELKPGSIYTETVLFQIPPHDQIGNHSLVLWADARFSRTSSANGNGPDNLWMPMQAGPLPLYIATPDASQNLHAQLVIDRSGWLLNVTDAQGQPMNPQWGYVETHVYDRQGSESGMGPLPKGVNGTVKQRWQEGAADVNASLALRVWAAVPGHVIATAMQIITGTQDMSRVFQQYKPDTQEFSSLDAAQAALGLPLARMQTLPANAFLENVRAEIYRYNSRQRSVTTQVYRFQNDARIELIQKNDSEKYSNAGWGDARYDAEARQLDVAGETGYLVRSYGWWVLNWKRGDVGFELRTPAEKISEAHLLEFARAVK